MRKITNKQTVKRAESYIPKGCRKPRTRYVDEVVKLSITELDESEAPVAFKIHKFDGEERIIRTCKGKFYAQDIEHNDGVWQPVKFSIDRLRFSLNWCWCEGEEVNYLDADSEERQRKYYAKHVVIGGETYRECGQPYYGWQTFGLCCSWIFTVEIPYSDYKDYEFKGISPDDRDGLQEKFDDMNKDRWESKHETLDEQLHFEWIEVLMPECCKHKFQSAIWEYNKWDDLDLDKQLRQDIIKFMERKKKEYAQHFRYLSNYDFGNHFEDAARSASNIVKNRIG